MGTQLQSALELANSWNYEPIPLWWSCDFCSQSWPSKFEPKYHL